MKTRVAPLADVDIIVPMLIRNVPNVDSARPRDVILCI
jgi:hypothetical protein